MLKPKRLEVGEHIGVVAPSRSVAKIDQRWLDEAEKFFERRGFPVIFSKHCRENWHGNGGTIEQRVSDLMEMFDDDRVGAILTAIGGYNSNQLLRHLDYEKIKSHPKIFMGYSDITALHNAIHTKTGLVTFYGPHFSTFGHPFQFDYTIRCFEESVIEGKSNVAIEANSEYAFDKWYTHLDNPQPRVAHLNPGMSAIQSGNAEGELVGGNLGTLTALLGTEYMPSTKGKILFVEEGDDDSAPEIDRAFTQLKLAGVLDEIKGLLVGRFHPDSGFNESQPPEELLHRLTKDTNIPVIYGADFGHTDPIATIPIGVPCLMDANRKKIQCLESGVL